MDFKIDNQEVETCFDSIAEQLLNNYDMQINQKKYQLTEIEFYFFCEQHQDGFTYDHNEVAGKLRFHYSGIDITLRSKDDKGYGGILIRGIKGIDDKDRIKGPLLVVKEISKPFINIFESNSIQFVKANPQRNYKIEDKEKGAIIKTERINLKKAIEKSDYKKSKYRYKLN